MSAQHLGIAVIGDQELVSALRLAGIRKHYTIEDNQDAKEHTRKALTELLGEPNVGLVIMLEDYAQYVGDLMAEARRKRGTTLVIVEVPSKSGTKYPNTKEYYRALIRESIGFEIEI